MQSFLFYDLETTGLVPAFDQVLQFAAIRTDLELNELSRHQFYVRISSDRIPNVHAVNTHQITPAMLADGLGEHAAIKYIHALLNQPGTCSIGYNSLAFDDIFLRFSFFRNLLDPYSHQYANGCMRADIMLMVLPFLNFARSALCWPEPLSLKLEQLVLAQGIPMGAAHDAMNDVLATLELARVLFKDRVRWDYVLNLFDKRFEADLSAFTDAILLSPNLGYADNFMAPVVLLGEHKVYKHKLYWRLDDPEWGQIEQEQDFSKLKLYKKKPGEQGFFWPSQPKFVAQMPSIQQAMRLENLKICAKYKALIQEYIAPKTKELYPSIPDLDIDAAIYQLGFKSRDLQALCALFVEANLPEKVRILEQMPEPYQEQARRIIWREQADALPAAHASAMSVYKSQLMTERMDHVGKLFPSNKTLMAELSESKTEIANSWFAHIEEKNTFNC